MAQQERPQRKPRANYDEMLLADLGKDVGSAVNKPSNYDSLKKRRILMPQWLGRVFFNNAGVLTIEVIYWNHTDTNKYDEPVRSIVRQNHKCMVHPMIDHLLANYNNAHNVMFAFRQSGVVTTDPVCLFVACCKSPFQFLFMITFL